MTLRLARRTMQTSIRQVEDRVDTRFSWLKPQTTDGKFGDVESGFAFAGEEEGQLMIWVMVCQVIVEEIIFSTRL